MQRDFTQADLTAIHTRQIMEAQSRVDDAALVLKARKERAKLQGVHWKDIKLALEFAGESDTDREQRANSIMSVLGALGQKVQLAFDFVRAYDDLDRQRGLGRMACVMNMPCEPPEGLSPTQNNSWRDGWADMDDLYQDYLDAQSSQALSDRTGANDALDKVMEETQDLMDAR